MVKKTMLGVRNGYKPVKKQGHAGGKLRKKGLKVACKMQSCECAQGERTLKIRCKCPKKRHRLEGKSVKKVLKVA